jgi:hypothetical protein
MRQMRTATYEHGMHKHTARPASVDSNGTTIELTHEEFMVTQLLGL